MLTSRGSNKRTDLDRGELRMLGLFGITTVLVFAVAGFVGIVF